jgi:hypothetical protein
MQSECRHRITCVPAEVCGLLARRQNVNIPQYFAVFFCNLIKIAMAEIFNYFIIFYVNTNRSNKYIALLYN